MRARSRRIRRQHRKWGKPCGAGCGILVRYRVLDDVLHYPERYTFQGELRLEPARYRMRWVPIDFGPDRTLDGMMPHHAGPMREGGRRR